MSIKTRGVEIFEDLLNSDMDAPDFSFLYDWALESDSFLPRLNDLPDFEFSGKNADTLKEVIKEFNAIYKLVGRSIIHKVYDHNPVSNSMSIFHKDGEPSLIALPVTEETEAHIGSHLLTYDLATAGKNTDILGDIHSLQEFIEGAEQFIKWRWWPMTKTQRKNNAMAAKQIYVSAYGDPKRNIFEIADTFRASIELSEGLRKASVKEWQRALLSLESTKDFPKDSIVVHLELEEIKDVFAALNGYSKFFRYRDGILRELRGSVNHLIEDRMNQIIDTLTVKEFITKMKGQRLNRKILETVLEQNLGNLKREYIIKDILQLRISKPGLFASKSLRHASNLIDKYLADQRLLNGVPELSYLIEHRPDFLKNLYVYKKYGELPYPSRRQFEALEKLLNEEPKEIHLLAKSDKELKRVLGSMESYTEPDRTKAFKDFVDPRDLEDFESTSIQYFVENPATFQAMMGSFGFNSLSLEQMSGFMAPEISKAIREIEVDTSGLKATLRSYQEFGVQYGIHQQKIVLGDEMGLGKTVTALGMANHLANDEKARSLFIVPLSVLENWKREIAKHTNLHLHVLYGEDLASNFENWLEHEGIALATYESMQKVNELPRASEISTLDFTVIDEIHNMKNPETKRSMAAIPWVRAADYAMLMSGTPLENKMEEFATLVAYVQPHLEVDVTANYVDFRRAVAPAYLRRNQVDVLSELPEKIDKKEYVELSQADREYYNRAIVNGDYHLARRAKILAGEKSATVKHIKEIVADAMSNNNKVLVFSYYLETIDTLRRVLKEDDPYTPITGAINAQERQKVLDKFTKAKEPGVLLAQISTAGTGLNIQSASVVIIVEPQTKPSLEEQAIRRSFRMGQTKPVQVFRLRGKDTLDEKWDVMLAQKQGVFDQTAGVSSDVDLEEIMDGGTAGMMAEEQNRLASLKN